MPAVREGSRRRSGEATRELVIDAAVEEFARAGYRGASTEAIATRAGISQPYVFRLFGSKQALFLTACERGFRHLMTTFREQAEQAMARGDDPFEAMGASYLTLIEDRRLLLLQMQSFIAAADEPAIRDTCRRSFAEMVDFLHALPGATDQCVSDFLATGMFLNVAAAIDLFAIAGSSDWARRCLEGVRMPHAGG